MACRVEVKPQVAKALAKIANPDRRKIARVIDALAGEPRPVGCRRLSGSEDAYRLRVGDYRVIYLVADRVLVVYVIRIGHRGDIYRGL